MKLIEGITPTLVTPEISEGVIGQGSGDIDLQAITSTGQEIYAKGYEDGRKSIDIVRCGECMHNGSYDTDCPFGWKNGKWNMPKPCDFCSYGERKDNE